MRYRFAISPFATIVVLLACLVNGLLWLVVAYAPVSVPFSRRTVSLTEASAIWVQAVSALLSLLLTLWLIRYSHRGWEAADRNAAAAQRSADAARLSAEVANQTLLLTNRPRLVIRPLNVRGFFPMGQIGDSLSGEAWITNVGVLQVTLIRFHAEWFYGERLPLVNPAHSALDYRTPATTVLPGHFGKLPLPRYEVPPAAHFGINNAVDVARRRITSEWVAESLFLFGYIKYQDQVGLRRRFFCYEYIPGRARFEEFDDPQYNYEE